MSDGFASLLRAFEDNTFLGLGVLVVLAGLFLPLVSPIEVFVEVWVLSLAGTILLGLGVLLIGAGLVHLLTDKGSIDSSNKRAISQGEFERKYSDMNLADSSANVQAIEALAKESKPLNRKEIAEKSGLSITYATHVLKSFVEKGYVLEFQVRGVLYYALAEKGLKLCEDFKATASGQKLIQPVSNQRVLADSWLRKNRSLYYSEKATGGSCRLAPKQRILLQQLVLAFGFSGGLFVHFGFNAGILSATSVLLILAIFAWLAVTVLCARTVAGSLGIVTLVLAWTSGFIVIVGEPLTTLGVTLLMSSTTIGALAALCSRTRHPLQL